MEELRNERVCFRREILIPGLGIEILKHHEFSEAEKVKRNVWAVLPTFCTNGSVNRGGVLCEAVGSLGHHKLGKRDSLLGKFCRKGQRGHGIITGPFEDVVVLDLLADEFNRD